MKKSADQGNPAAPGIPTLEEWVSRVPPRSAEELAAARVAARAALRKRILAEEPMVDASHHLAAVPGAFSVLIDGQRWYPVFQFRADGSVPEQMHEILAAVYAGRPPENPADRWLALEWFSGKTGLLSGRRPMDVFALDPDAVLKAAQREFARYLRPAIEPDQE